MKAVMSVLFVIVAGSTLGFSQRVGSAHTKQGLRISAADAIECDHAVAEGMKLFYDASTAFLMRQNTTDPITEVEKKLLANRMAIHNRIGACFVTKLPNGDPIQSLMAENHEQLAQERYALQIQLLIDGLALDIIQKEKLPNSPCN